MKTTTENAPITFQSEVAKEVEHKHGQLLAENKMLGKQLLLWKAKAESWKQKAEFWDKQHAELFKEIVEAKSIISDMVKNLDAADYDRARKFLETPIVASNAKLCGGGEQSETQPK